jgi:hypothetical protein
MTQGCEVAVKVINIPDTDVTVDLYIHDMGGHEAFLEHIPKYVQGTYRRAKALFRS